MATVTANPKFDFPLPKAVTPLPTDKELNRSTTNIPIGIGVNTSGSFGMKFDGGKQLAGILFEDFPNALSAVVEIATYGANKYARNSWLQVPNNLQRYKDALVRHQLAQGRGEVYDAESHLLHAAHFAWNALAVLEIALRNGAVTREVTIVPYAPVSGTMDLK